MGDPKHVTFWAPSKDQPKRVIATALEQRASSMDDDSSDEEIGPPVDASQAGAIEGNELPTSGLQVLSKKTGKPKNRLGFRINQVVRMKNGNETCWKEGKVTKVSPLEVNGFEWKYI